MPDVTFKTVCQYSHNISDADMQKLREIACDYSCVKNCVYRRYGGVGGLPKLYSGYTIQNEMTDSGLRQEFTLPVPYFYPAVFEASANIKAGWKLLRKKISYNALHNPNFSDQERHYICCVLKHDQMFASVLSRDEFEPPKNLGDCTEGELALDRKKLHNYINRQVRKYKPEYKTNRTDYFSITPKGYRYGDGGIYVTTKEKRQRVFLPLTDHNTYNRQLRIFLRENSVVIHSPINIRVKRHPDYLNEIALSPGYHIMFTSSTGHEYGQEYGIRRSADTDHMKKINAAHKTLQSIREKHISKGNTLKVSNIDHNNLGRTKYLEWKKRQNQAIKAYINAEIDRLITTEKPAVIYIPKFQRRQGSKNKFSKNLNTHLAGNGAI